MCVAELNYLRHTASVDERVSEGAPSVDLEMPLGAFVDVLV